MEFIFQCVGERETICKYVAIDAIFSWVEERGISEKVVRKRRHGGSKGKKAMWFLEGGGGRLVQVEESSRVKAHRRKYACTHSIERRTIWLDWRN